jgi:hypothetical protein
MLAVAIKDGVSPLLFAEARNTVVKLYAHIRLCERGIMEYGSADKCSTCCSLLLFVVHSPFVGAREIDIIARHGL